jgi:hypothetical protein
MWNIRARCVFPLPPMRVARSVTQACKYATFALLKSGSADPGNIKLNHYLHLQPGLIGPDNSRVQMTCEDCHQLRPHIEQATSQVTPVSLADLHERRSGRMMATPLFARNCASCHNLQFDRRFGDLQVPHDMPQAIHDFLVKQFTEYIAAHPNSMHDVEPPPGRDLPRARRQHRVAHSAAEWVAFRVDDAEWLLWAKTCKQCHTVNARENMLPEIAKSNITPKWLSNATFDHSAHSMMACVTCHAKSADSHETSDILLPGISTCKECHREAGPAKNAVEGRCIECHQYHDWSKAKPTKGRFTIPQLVGELRVRP